MTPEEYADALNILDIVRAGYEQWAATANTALLKLPPGVMSRLQFMHFEARQVEAETWLTLLVRALTTEAATPPPEPPQMPREGTSDTK